jgi:primosomal protein N' (replication factor Y)
VAQQFLQAAADAAPGLEGSGHVFVYAPVPMTVQRVANVERAQLLLESGSRPALQAFLADWQGQLQAVRPRGLIRWAVDVDPLVI